MHLQTHLTPSGFLLPSIHSAPPFFTEQPFPASQTEASAHWARLIVTYARHRRLFYLRLEDGEAKDTDWDEILRNPRINRRVKPSYLSSLMEYLVLKNMAAYEPPKQTNAVLVYWRNPEEWGEVLHDWANTTGQLNTILTFYEISSPSVPSPLSDIPTPLLRKAIQTLTKSNRAQIISVADGEGVRMFSGK